MKEVLSNRSEKIILVIRDGIAERVKEYFNVTVAAIINNPGLISDSVSYTHLRAHETVLDLVCRLLLEKKKKKQPYKS